MSDGKTPTAAANDFKNALCKAVDKYFSDMKDRDYHSALSAADYIRNIGLQLASDAWNTAMEVNKRMEK